MDEGLAGTPFETVGDEVGDRGRAHVTAVLGLLASLWSTICSSTGR